MPDSRHAPQRVTRSNLVATIGHALDVARAAAAAPDVILHLPALTVRLHCSDPDARRNCLIRLAVTAPDPANPLMDVMETSPEDRVLPPPPLWGEATYVPRDVEMLLQDTPYRASYFHDLGLWHLWDRRHRFGLQWMQARGAVPPWEPAGPLRIFLHWALSGPHDRLVHSGTLGLKGKAVLLAGRGGSGKSATVTAGIAAGMQSAGDDYVHIRIGPERTCVLPVFSTLKQDAAGLKRLGLADTAAAGEPNWQGKHEFFAADIGGKPLTGPLDLKAVLVPVISGGPLTAVVPGSSRDAMLALAPSALFQMPGERDSGVAFFAALVRRLPCSRLNLGYDPVQMTQCLRMFLDQSP